MSALKKNLIERLIERGMEPNLIPGFIRLLVNAVMVNPHMDLMEANERLHSLGWDSFELDYHTFQLAIACFEAEGLNDSENISDHFFENSLSGFESHTDGC